MDLHPEWKKGLSIINRNDEIPLVVKNFVIEKILDDLNKGADDAACLEYWKFEEEKPPTKKQRKFIAERAKNKLKRFRELRSEDKGGNPKKNLYLGKCVESCAEDFYAKRKAARGKKHMDWWDYKAVVATNEKRQVKVSFEGTRKGKTREDEWWEFSQVPNSVKWNCEIPDWYHEDEAIKLLWDQKIVNDRMRKRKQQYLVHYSYPNDPDKDSEEWQLAKNIPNSLIEDYRAKSAQEKYGYPHEPHCPPYTESSDTDSDPYPVSRDEALERQEALENELEEFIPYLIKNGVKKPKKKESKEGDKFLALLQKCKRIYKHNKWARQQWRKQLTLQLIGKLDDEVAISPMTTNWWSDED